MTRSGIAGGGSSASNGARISRTSGGADLAKLLFFSSVATLCLTAEQPAWADATQLNPSALSGGDQTIFSGAVASGSGFALSTAGGTTVQLEETSGGTLTEDSTGATFTSGLFILQGDISGNTSAFTNALFTLNLFDASDALFTIYTDGFSNSFDFPVTLTAGATTLAFGAINNETISGIGIGLGAAGTTPPELTSLTFDATANGEPGDVPEPATWAMMAIGFGAIGAAARRRRRLSLR